MKIHNANWHENNHTAVKGRIFAAQDLARGIPGSSRNADRSQSYRDAYDARIARSTGPVLIATQEEFDAVAASKPVRTGPRYGSILAETMALVRTVHGYGRVKARRTAARMLSDGRGAR